MRTYYGLKIFKPAQMIEKKERENEEVYFAGGCLWGVQEF